MQIISKIFASHDAALAALKAASPLLVSTDMDGVDHLSLCGLDAGGARFDVVLTPLTTQGAEETLLGATLPDGTKTPDMRYRPVVETGEFQVDLYWQGEIVPIIDGGTIAETAAIEFSPPTPDM